MANALFGALSNHRLSIINNKSLCITRVAYVVSFHYAAPDAECHRYKQYYGWRSQHIERPQFIADVFDSLAFLHFYFPQLLAGFEFFQLEVFCLAG
jgi:hypothetical protein